MAFKGYISTYGSIVLYRLHVYINCMRAYGIYVYKLKMHVYTHLVFYRPRAYTMYVYYIHMHGWYGYMMYAIYIELPV